MDAVGIIANSSYGKKSWKTSKETSVAAQTTNILNNREAGRAHKVDQLTKQHTYTVSICRDDIRKAKVQNEPRPARDANDNKKREEQVKGTGGLSRGEEVTDDGQNVELLKSYFASAFFC